jgi:hypothetical protein
MRLLSLVVLAGGVAVGHLMLESPRRASIVRPDVHARQK